jgi:hypothetical protein
MWKINLEQGSAPIEVSPGGCITYGSTLSGYRQLIAAKLLTPGNTYYARMNLLVADPARRSILFYDAVFCVEKLPDWKILYLQYVYERDGAVVKPVCRDSN